MEGLSNSPSYFWVKQKYEEDFLHDELCSVSKESLFTIPCSVINLIAFESRVLEKASRGYNLKFSLYLSRHLDGN